MSRFTWNAPSKGRLINRYVDTMCKEFPAIMRQVAKKGIKGNLGSWFDESNNAEKATCGCLVGTTCIVAIEKYNHLSMDQKKSHDAAMVLYDLVVRKSKRDVSKYDRPECTSNIEETGNTSYDPLLVLIYRAGMAASDEAYVLFDYTVSYEEHEDRNKARHKAVVDHIEHRIRTRLDMPYPKRKRA